MNFGGIFSVEFLLGHCGPPPMFCRIGGFVLACWLVATAICTREAAGQNPKSPQGAASATKPDNQDPKAPAQQGKTLRFVKKDGKLIRVPDDRIRDLQFNPTPAPQPVSPPRSKAEGVKELFKNLADGDPIAWTVVIGMTASIVLAVVVGSWWPRKKPDTLDAAQIAAAWQNQRGLCYLAAAVLVIGVVLGALLGVASHSGVPLLVCLFPTMFVGMVMLVVNMRCPACGASMGKDWNPTFCPKCGVRLKETEQPGQGSPGAGPNQSAEADGGPRS